MLRLKFVLWLGSTHTCQALVDYQCALAIQSMDCGVGNAHPCTWCPGFSTTTGWHVAQPDAIEGQHRWIHSQFLKTDDVQAGVALSNYEHAEHPSPRNLITIKTSSRFKADRSKAGPATHVVISEDFCRIKSLFFRYFDPLNIFFYNENKYFSGWPKRYFG